MGCDSFYTPAISVPGVAPVSESKTEVVTIRPPNGPILC